jgi:hypothetical protein
MRLFWGILHILLCVVIVCGSILLLGHYIGQYTYSTLGEWANFATYLSLSLSAISVIYIFLTYWSQIKMSSVIQFESTFFQWYQIHNDLLQDLKSQIDYCVDNTIIPMLTSADLTDLEIFERIAQKEIDRPLHRYYRSMYQLFKYIKLSPILSGFKQRKKYYDIIQSNMSDKELLLFLCFVLGDENRDKKVIGSWYKRISFKDLIDESHVLKNCYPGETLLRPMTPIVRKSFPKTAVKSFHFFKEE